MAPPGSVSLASHLLSVVPSLTPLSEQSRENVSTVNSAVDAAAAVDALPLSVPLSVPLPASVQQ